MTRSHHVPPLAAALVAIALAAAAPSLAAHHEDAEGGGAHADHAQADAIEIVSTNVQGKNVFIPSTVVVEAGEAAVLSVFNTTDTPHGFTIEAAKIEVVLMPAVEQRIDLPALEPGIYKIGCHLHPPHRSGRLVVVDFDD